MSEQNAEDGARTSEQIDAMYKAGSVRLAQALISSISASQATTSTVTR